MTDPAPFKNYNEITELIDQSYNSRHILADLPQTSQVLRALFLSADAELEDRHIDPTIHINPIKRLLDQPTSPFFTNLQRAITQAARGTAFTPLELRIGARVRILPSARTTGLSDRFINQVGTISYVSPTEYEVEINVEGMDEYIYLNNAAEHLEAE